MIVSFIAANTLLPCHDLIPCMQTTVAVAHLTGWTTEEVSDMTV